MDGRDCLALEDRLPHRPRRRRRRRPRSTRGDLMRRPGSASPTRPISPGPAWTGRQLFPRRRRPQGRGQAQAVRRGSAAVARPGAGRGRLPGATLHAAEARAPTLEAAIDAACRTIEAWHADLPGRAAADRDPRHRRSRQEPTRPRAPSRPARRLRAAGMPSGILVLTPVARPRRGDGGGLAGRRRRRRRAARLRSARSRSPASRCARTSTRSMPPSTAGSDDPRHRLRPRCAPLRLLRRLPEAAEPPRGRRPPTWSSPPTTRSSPASQSMPAASA